jgi:hypothetical protein
MVGQTQMLLTLKSNGSVLRCDVATSGGREFPLVSYTNIVIEDNLLVYKGDVLHVSEAYHSTSIDIYQQSIAHLVDKR